MDKNEKQILTGSCPNCMARLEYYAGEKYVTCNCCDSVIDVEKLITESKTARPIGGSSNFVGSSINFGQGQALSVLASGIDSPESAIFYVKNIYDRYDWEHYKYEGVLFPEDVQLVVEDKKIKSGASPLVWYLDFQSKIIPLGYKLDALLEMEQKMYDVYNPQDYTQSYQVFGNYSFIMSLLIVNKDSIIKDLNLDISNAKELKLDAAKIKEMEASLESLVKKYEKNVHPTTELKDEPIIIKAKKDLDAKFAKEYSERTGGDANKIYAEAVESYRLKDYIHAASLFTEVKGYSDSLWYLEKLNKNFIFDDSIIKIGDKDFFIRGTKMDDYIFNVKNPSSQTNQVYSNYYGGSAYSLFAIDKDNHIDEKTPLIVGITQIISSFAGKLIFIHKNEDICCFNSKNNTMTILIDGKKGDFSVDVSGKSKKSNVFYFNKERTGIFFRQKIIREKKPEIKEGCLSMFKKPKQEPVVKEVVNNNNYSLMYLDLVSLQITKIIPEMIDVVEYKNRDASMFSNALSGTIAEYGDIIFYIAEKPGSENSKGEMEAKLYIYDLKTNSDIDIIDKDCEINDVQNEFVIYSQWDPNDYNKHLYVLDSIKGTRTLIEKNVLDFKFANASHVFYTVGNDYLCPLISNTYDGQNRMEIMRRIEKIFDFQSGWIYVVKGSGLNTALIKVSEDGQTRLTVCTQISYLLDITPSNVYYIDTRGNLCSVRVNGSGYKVMCEDVSRDDVIIGHSKIFIFRKENVDEKNRAYSIYVTDLDGSNLKKLEFNVSSVKNYDENYIYVRKDEDLLFEYKDMDDSNQEYTTFVKHKRVSYHVFDKNTFELKPIYVNKDPDAKEKVIGGGCLKKKKRYKPTYTLVPNKVTVKRPNIAEAGAVNAEVKAAEEAAQALTASRIQNVRRTANSANGPLTLMIMLSIICLVAGVLLSFSYAIWLPLIPALIALLVGGIVTIKATKNKTRKGSLLSVFVGFVLVIIVLIRFFVRNNSAGGLLIGILAILAAIVILLTFIILNKKKVFETKGPKVLFIGLTAAAFITGAIFLGIGPIKYEANRPNGTRGGTTTSSAAVISTDKAESTNTKVQVSYNEITYFKYVAKDRGEYVFSLSSGGHTPYFTIYKNNTAVASMSSSQKTVRLKISETIYIAVGDRGGSSSRSTTLTRTTNPNSYDTYDAMLGIKYTHLSYDGTVGSRTISSSAPRIYNGSNLLAINSSVSYFQFTASSVARYTFSITSGNASTITYYYSSGGAMDVTSNFVNLTSSSTIYIGLKTNSSVSDYVDVTLTITSNSKTYDGTIGSTYSSSAAPAISTGNNLLALNTSYSYYRFIASTTGNYTFDVLNNSSANISIRTISDLSIGSSNSGSITVGLAASTTYYFACSISTTNGFSYLDYTVKVSSSSVDCTSFGSGTMSSTTPAVEVGTTKIGVNSVVSYHKFAALKTGNHTITATSSSTGAIITVNLYNSNQSAVSMSNGKANLTKDQTYYIGLTSSEGNRKYSSTTLQIEAPTYTGIIGTTSISSNTSEITDETDMVALQYNHNYFKFVPEKTDNYTFTLGNSIYTFAIRDANNNSIVTSSSSKSIAAGLVASTTYYMYCNISSGITGDYADYSLSIVAEGINGKFGSNSLSTTAPELAAEGEKLITKSGANYYKYIPTETDNYSFTLDKTYSSMAIYNSSGSSLKSVTSGTLKYGMTKNTTYYFYVSQSGSSTVYQSYGLTISADGVENLSGSSISTAPLITEEATSIATRYSYNYFKFVPEETGNYTFTLNKSVSTIAIKNSSDSNIASSSSNSSITAGLTKGTTYYFYIYESSTPTSFNVYTLAITCVKAGVIGGSSINTASDIDLETEQVSMKNSSNYFKFVPEKVGNYTFAFSKSVYSVTVYDKNQSTIASKSSTSTFTVGLNGDGETPYYIMLGQSSSSSVTFNIFGVEITEEELEGKLSVSYYYSNPLTLDVDGDSLLIKTGDNYYKFIPDETGNYTFSVDKTFTTMSIRDSGNSSLLSTSSGTLKYGMTKNTTYYFYLYNSGLTAGQYYPYKLTIEKEDLGVVGGTSTSNAPTIDEETTNIGTKYSSTNYYKFVPEKTDNYTFTLGTYASTIAIRNSNDSTIVSNSSATSVSCALEAGLTYYFTVYPSSGSSNCYSKNTLKITAANISGTTGSDNRSPSSPSLEEGINDLVASSKEKYFIFTPSTSGSYVFTLQNQASNQITINFYSTKTSSSSTYTNVSSSNFGSLSSQSLTAGVNYYIGIVSSSSTMLGKCQVYVQNTNNYISGASTRDESNPEVTDGLSYIRINGYSTQNYFKFVASEDAYYEFKNVLNNNYYTNARLYDADGNLLKSATSGSYSTKLAYHMKKGETYYIQINHTNSYYSSNYYYFYLQITSMEEYPVSFTVQAEVEDGENDIDITTSTRYFKYVATETGTVTIMTTGNGDTYGLLYDFTGTETLAENDDGGTGGNFKLTYSVVEGETYYIGIRFVYSSTASVGLTISFD